MHLLPELWAGCVVFLLGAVCGMLAAWRRYTLALQDRDAQAKREAEKIAGFMLKGVEFNQSILDILRAQGAVSRQVTIDWELLTQAANGAGLLLVKAAPCTTERVN